MTLTPASREEQRQRRVLAERRALIAVHGRTRKDELRHERVLDARGGEELRDEDRGETRSGSLSPLAERAEILQVVTLVP